MGLWNDIVATLTGRKQEQAPQPPTPSAAGGPPSWGKMTWEKPKPPPKGLQNVPRHSGPGRSPTAKLLDKFPDVKELGKQVYNGQIPPSPGPLEKQKEPTQHKHDFHPPGGKAPPSPGGMGLGGGATSPAPPRTTTPPPPPAPPPPRKPPPVTFEQFIGAAKSKGMDR